MPEDTEGDTEGDPHSTPCCNHVTSTDLVYLKPASAWAAVAEPRRYCTACGLARERCARPPEHFVNLLLNLNRHLGERSHQGIHPLTQAERRLAIRAIRTGPVFADGYGSTYSMQGA